MEKKYYYKIKLNDLDDVLNDAREYARFWHPKQRRRRFDAENSYVLEHIELMGVPIQVYDFTHLNPVALVYKRKVNLGTKKWADYRVSYEPVYGTIEKETEAGVKIRGTWYRKEKIIAIVTPREVPDVKEQGII